MTIEAGKELKQTALAVTGPENPGNHFRLTYLPGLDGLRALAVLAVMFYHAGVGFMVGGFLGVDVFFVISGFLITSLLLSERGQAGHTNLKAFWWRRARRLLPALFLLLFVTVIFSVIFLPGELTGLRGDVVAALTYVTNWELIFNQRSYFEAIGRPPLLRHLWSLAVEEQFYIIWPVVFVLGMRLKQRRYLLYGLGLAALASAVWMALLYQPDVDPSRVYYGTDTRASGLLVGVMLAFIPFLSPEISWQGRRTKLKAYLVNLAGLAALAVLFYSFVSIDQFQSFLYQGGFLFLSLVTAVIIFGVVHPLSYLGQVFEWRPLRYIGQRSYSLYLWHWPIFNVTRPQLDLPLDDGLLLLALRFGLTFLLAELSYRFVETPIRQGKLEQLWQRWKNSQGEARRRLKASWLSAGVVSVMVSSMLVLALVEAKAPPPPDYLPGQTPGQVGSLPVEFGTTPDATLSPTIFPTATATPAATATPTAPAFTATALAPGQTPVSTPTPAPDPTATPVPTATPPPAPTATPRPAPPVTAVGDSVLLGAGNELHRLIGPMIYEADVGMQAKTGVQMIQSFKDQGQLGPTVIIHLGTNGYFADKSFDDMMNVIGPNRRVFFVNVRAPREWEGPNNKVIQNGVKRYSNAYLIDWYSVSAGHPEYFVKDGVHLTPIGITVYTSLIANAIK
jgi:peptidoglycan/LPS O-acetylase OafA/YrhL